MNKNHEVSTSSTARSTLPTVWFLRGALLDRIAVILAGAAIVTEVFVLAFAGETVLGYLGVLLSAGGLVLSRFRPMLGLVVATLGAVAAALFSTESVGMWSVVVFLLFSVTVRGGRAISALLIAGVPVYFSLVARAGWDFQAPVALVASACCAVGAAAGSAVRAQGQYLESMRQRALDAEAASELAVERGVAEERLRIARDLHDAVGHEVAVISMNLGAAEVQLPPGSDAARVSLASARTGVKRVLQEIQQILDILRRGDSDADLVPVADILQLPVLVRAFQGAGASITTHIDDVGNVDPSVSVAAFRIAQEALTNAQRYGTGSIELSVLNEGDSVVVDIQNRRVNHPAMSTGSGYGLVGMKERAESVGGKLEIIEDAERFRVRAHLKRREDGDR